MLLTVAISGHNEHQHDFAQSDSIIRVGDDVAAAGVRRDKRQLLGVLLGGLLGYNLGYHGNYIITQRHIPRVYR